MPAAAPPLVAVAHGSRDPRAAATVDELISAVRARIPGVDVRAAFLDHCAPSLPQVLGSLKPDDPISASGPVPPALAAGRRAPFGSRSQPGECVVLPLLLTAAYHSKTDIPAQLAAAVAACPGLDAVCAGTLGPHPLLLAALERRLREAGVAVDDAAARAETSVVLAAAGSSDPAANATIAALAARWQRERGWRAVVPAYASAAVPRPADAVRDLRDTRGCPPGEPAGGTARGIWGAGAPHAGGTRPPGEPAGGTGGRPPGKHSVVVATYLLAPGYFADKIRDAALGAGADAVSEVLGAAPEVADVVLDRYLAAAADPAWHGAFKHGALQHAASGDGASREGFHEEEAEPTRARA